MISQTEYMIACRIVKDYEAQRNLRGMERFLKLDKGDNVTYIGGCGAKLTKGNKYKLMWKPRIMEYKCKKDTVQIRIKNDSGNPTMVSAEYFKF